MRGSRTVLTIAISKERLDSALYIGFSCADGHSAQKPDRRNALGGTEHGAFASRITGPLRLNRLLGHSARMRSFGNWPDGWRSSCHQLSRIRVEKVDRRDDGLTATASRRHAWLNTHMTTAPSWPTNKYGTSWRHALMFFDWRDEDIVDEAIETVDPLKITVRCHPVAIGS